MAVEYLVLQAEAEAGPFGPVTAHKLHQSWETLQAALDELGQHGWDLYTTIYSATREHRGPGEHYCEGFIFKRMASAAAPSAAAEASAIVAEALDIVEHERLDPQASEQGIRGNGPREGLQP
jgi:hypothetical protein